MSDSDFYLSKYMYAFENRNWCLYNSKTDIPHANHYWILSRLAEVTLFFDLNVFLSRLANYKILNLESLSLDAKCYIACRVFSYDRDKQILVLKTSYSSPTIREIVVKILC